MEESVIIKQLKQCKAIYVSYKIFFYKVTQPCFYLTSLNQEAYIGLKIDDYYFNNDEAGYHIRLQEELNDKRAITIYGVYDDGSLLILEGYKTAVTKGLFNDLDKSLVNDSHYYTYRLTEVTGRKYGLQGKPIEIEDIDKWIVIDDEKHRFSDYEPALHYFRQTINSYINMEANFIRDDTICVDSDFNSVLPEPLYKFFLEKHNNGTLSEEERQVIESVESILFTTGLDERDMDEDFLIFKVIDLATEEEKHYEYEDSEYQIKITIEKELFEIKCINNKNIIDLKTNALGMVKGKSYFFNCHQTLLNDEHNLDISFDCL